MSNPWWNQYVGIPYVPRGRDKATGLDCYGLLIRVYKEQFGITIPDYAYDAAATPSPAVTCDLIDHAVKTPALWHLIPNQSLWNHGDVAVFSLTALPFHTGILLPRHYMLHCVTKLGVVVERLSKNWTNRLVGVYRHEERQSPSKDNPVRV